MRFPFTKKSRIKAGADAVKKAPTLRRAIPRSVPKPSLHRRESRPLYHRDRYLTTIGISVAALLGTVAFVALRSRSGKDEAHAPAPPLHTSGSTPDKPAGTELHPPNQNPSRQGPAGAPGPKSKAPKAPPTS